MGTAHRQAGFTRKQVQYYQVHPHSSLFWTLVSAPARGRTDRAQQALHLLHVCNTTQRARVCIRSATLVLLLLRTSDEHPPLLERLTALLDAAGRVHCRGALSCLPAAASFPGRLAQASDMPPFPFSDVSCGYISCI